MVKFRHAMFTETIIQMSTNATSPLSAEEEYDPAVISLRYF
jgi:hypothetical protein